MIKTDDIIASYPSFSTRHSGLFSISYFASTPRCDNCVYWEYSSSTCWNLRYKKYSLKAHRASTCKYHEAGEAPPTRLAQKERSLRAKREAESKVGKR